MWRSTATCSPVVLSMTWPTNLSEPSPAVPALQMSLDEKLNLVQQAAAQFLQDEQKEADG